MALYHVVINVLLQDLESRVLDIFIQAVIISGFSLSTCRASRCFSHNVFDVVENDNYALLLILVQSQFSVFIAHREHPELLFE